MPIEHWNPIPIYYKDHETLPENLTKELDLCLNKIESFYEQDSWQDNVYSTIQKCPNIVRELKMCNLYQFMLTHLTEYFKELNFLPTDINLYNSWFNKIYKNGFQDLHMHNFNCVSGCLYYEQNFKSENGIEFSFNNHSLSNEMVTYAYKPGRIILFPGHVYHRVLYKKTDGVRKSFSFNFLIC